MCQKLECGISAFTYRDGAGILAHKRGFDALKQMCLTEQNENNVILNLGGR